MLRMIRGATRVIEHSHYSAAARQCTITLDLPVVGKRVDVLHRYEWVDFEDGSGTRISWRAHCRARVPLLGKRIERFVLGELESGVRDVSAYANRWLAEQTQRR